MGQCHPNSPSLVVFFVISVFHFFSLLVILIKFVITLLIEFCNIPSNSFFAEEHNKGAREKCLHLFQTPAMQSTENFNRNVILHFCEMLLQFRHVKYRSYCKYICIIAIFVENMGGNAVAVFFQGSALYSR